MIIIISMKNLNSTLCMVTVIKLIADILLREVRECRPISVLVRNCLELEMNLFF